MKIRGPFDTATGAPADPATPYTDGDPSTGTPGSVPSAVFFNEVYAEIAAAIDNELGDGSSGSGQDQADLEQLHKAIKRATGGDGQRTVFANKGYRQFDDGFMIQWGDLSTGATGNGATGTETFRIAFPIACYQVILSSTTGSVGPTGGTSEGMYVSSKSTASFTWLSAWNSRIALEDPIGWVALGRWK